MGLIRNVGTIGGLTAVSRLAGFGRDLLLARLLGAGAAADAFQLAFVLPNTFRRLFAEGAFSVAFVPMYARTLHAGGEEAAERFANHVLAIFVWTMFGVSALAMLCMPLVVWILASDFRQIPGKFELAVTLSRITFPYLGLVAIVAMLSGLLNARARFAPGAFVPLLLNLVLIAGILFGFHLRDSGSSESATALALAVSVTGAGLAQLGYMVWAVRRAGVRLALSWPRLTPEVRKLARLIVPATLGAGIYQASQFVDTFFATTLPEGSLTLLRYADRLNGMPVGIIGIALGTAMLPLLARHIDAAEDQEAQRLQTNAVEVTLLLTLPAAVALAICAPAFVTALFVGGRMTAEDGAVMSGIVIALACGLPAYVLVKVLQPAFFSRDDTRTPMWAAAFALTVNIAVNVLVVPRYGVVGLAGATAFAAMVNVAVLAIILERRGWFAVTWQLIARVLRQAVAAGAMGVGLWLLAPMLADHFRGGLVERAMALAILVASGLVAFFTAAIAIGALDKHRIAQLRPGASPDFGPDHLR